jgi:phage regulator Rha-like protein
MQHLITSTKTMTSVEIAELTNKRHDQVLRTARELVEQGVTQSVETPYRHPQNGVEYPQHVLNKRDSLVLVARLSPEFTGRVVDRWMELEAAAPARQLSPAEMFLQNAQAMVDMERRQLAQEQAVARIEQRVEQVAQTQLLTARPANSESICHLRPRAAKMFGIPEHVVERVIRQSPLAPRPAGMVKNDRAEAEGSSYAVYWVKDVNDVLRRFVGECKMVTPSFATHPYIDQRFKLARREAS